MDSINVNSLSFKELKKSEPAETAKKPEPQNNTPEEKPQLTGAQKALRLIQVQHQINQLEQKMMDENYKNPDVNLDIYYQQLAKLCEYKNGLQKEIDQRITDYFKK